MGLTLQNMFLLARVHALMFGIMLTSDSGSRRQRQRQLAAGASDDCVAVVVEKAHVLPLN